MKKIIVIGGGIGGLSAALMLESKGFYVKLFEAARHLQPVGAGLGVGSNALKALYEAGIGAQIDKLGNPLKILDFRDSSDRLLNEMDVEALSKKEGVNSVAIHRAELHEQLYRAIRPGTIELNKKCIAFRQYEESAEVTFEDGSVAEGDYVIAADGIHSLFRQKLVPNSVPRYAGYTCWRGVVDETDIPYDKQTSTEIWGKEGRFGIVPLKNKRVYWFACVNAKRNDQKYRQFRVEDVARHFDSFSPRVSELIRETDDGRLLHHDILDIKPLNQFVFGRIILLGDAAHATTPNMGQGAGQAIEDAIVLANCLSSHKNFQDAFKTYEKKRIKRTKKIITMSRRIGAGAQLENKTVIWVRNKLFKFVPKSLLIKRFQFVHETDLRGTE
ncbi:monooxygenase [Pueribacillus theae]|uniref:Monooxygenase n=1 Tax=Pueribacillus theae TaxID=2171751 RepID=A0A2U1JPF1_9BACI|nr:FAD-dependent monooxygenase [Pueribacillus theae]PWA07056.1 monooxygenase [Pueribacillus theae]